MDRQFLAPLQFHVGKDERIYDDKKTLISPVTPSKEQCPSEVLNSKTLKQDRSKVAYNQILQSDETVDIPTVSINNTHGTENDVAKTVPHQKFCKVAGDAENQGCRYSGLKEESVAIEIPDDEENNTSDVNENYLRHRESIFGEKPQTTSQNGSSQHEHRLADYFAGLLTASENKLTMKFFGTQSTAVKEKQRQMMIQSCIIHPCSNFRLYWDLLMLAFLGTNIIVLPVSIAFFFNDLGSHWMIFNIVCDSLFLIDIGINFRTGLLDEQAKGEIILDGKTIAIRYLKGWFLLDMISSVPLDYLFLSFEGYSYTAGRAIRILRLAKLLQLLRLLRLSRLVRYVKIWQEYFSMATIVVRIFNLICIMVLLSHWSGCIQFFVPVIQGWPEDSWIARENLQEVHWWEQYTKSLFKALSHMLSIGYGKYPPANNTDMWLTIASMLAGATCYALFVGHATTLIQSFDTSSRQYRDHMQQVNEYMSYRKLPKDLRRRVTSYYDHKFGGKMFDEASILAELSHTLRSVIIKHNCKQLISTVPFFEKGKDEGNFVDDVLSRLSFEMAMPNDDIIKANTRADKMYFIQEGVVKVLSEDGEVVTRLSDGSYFGEVALLSGKRRVADVQAETYCNLFSLSKEDFDIILENYPVMRKTMETVAAKRVHNLGKDPAIVSSRESLLEDVDDIHEIMQANAEKKPSDEEEVDLDLSPPEEKQFLTVFKSFFTSDSEGFSREVERSRANSRCLSSSKLSKDESCNGSPMGLSKLVLVPNMARRASSAIELTACSAHSGASLLNSTGNSSKPEEQDHSMCIKTPLVLQSSELNANSNDEAL